MRWIDHHCHFPADEARSGDWLRSARDSGVRALIDVGCDLLSSRRAIDRASIHHDVWATVGVHPHEASGGMDGMEELLGLDRVVAVGECGLDYHYMHSPAPVQREVFARQIQLANTHRLPLVVHSREAWSDTFAVLGSEGVPERTVFHCFTGGVEEAEECLEMGALLSFSGIVTFPAAGELQEAARCCPLDRMLVETDSPYLAPVPHRGRPNMPGNVTFVGEAIARLRGLRPEEVAESTTATASAFYRLDLPEGAE
ncbi:MAG: TatD family hydrolase [Microthrixaceae bacterium]|nr:TatD family hydrolase [Microthrixaceae bacterium]